MAGAENLGAMGQGLSGVGSLLGAAAQFNAGRAAGAQGKATQAAKEAEARIARIRAGQERAASQRKMHAARERENLIQSQIQARSAASGAGAADPTVANLAGDLAAEGEYRAQSALYEGNSFSDYLNSLADIKQWEGNEAAKAGKYAAKTGKFAALGSLLGSFKDLTAFTKFGEPTKPDQKDYWAADLTPDFGPYGKNGMRPY